MCVFYIENTGSQHIYSCPLTDDEMAAYKKYPDTFFGVVLNQGKYIEEGDALGFFEWAMNTYSKSSKEQLLEFMKDHPDYASLTTMTQEDLSVIYCERIAVNIVHDQQRARAMRDALSASTEENNDAG